MSNSTTGDPALTAEAKVIGSVGVETFVTISKLGLIPIITILGIVGNTLSIIILFKHGFQTSSNVLLFALAVADLMVLTCTYSIPALVYEFYGNNSFPFNESAARVWFIFHRIIHTLRNAVGYNVSMFVPMVITIERLFAVFLPLHFHMIITPVRVAVPVAILTVYCIAREIQSSLIVGFVIEHDETFNTTAGKFQFVDYYKEHYAFYIQSTVSVVALELFPAIFTAFGCVIISIKIKMLSQKRKEMASSSSSSGKSSTSQTTKTMLAVCSVYSCVSLYNFSTGIPQLVGVDLIVDGQWTPLGQMLMILSNLANTINSSCNFAIYIFFNKNFRDTLMSLFVGKGNPVNGKGSWSKARETSALPSVSESVKHKAGPS